jgi:hypothetical protein
MGGMAAERLRTILVRLAAATAGGLALAACGSAQPPPPVPPHSAAERLWVDNAYRFIQLLEARLTLAAAGGSSLPAARKALSNTSDLYSTLVAYTYFGDCNPELASVGRPSARAAPAVRTLIAVCGRLERASNLFHLAVTRSEPKLLLRASRLDRAAAPLLYRASSELAALHVG